ncbi:MAG: GDSL-type esterase/lipase family protein [Opitutaceae bacterium]
MRFTALLLLPLTLVAAQPQPPIPADRWSLPADETGLPGEGALRRYDGYVRRWHDARQEWAGRVAADQGAVVFLGDSITQGWGNDFKGAFAGMKLANRGIGGDTTRGMLIRLQEDVLSLNPAAIVLLLGTNDLEVGIAPEAAGRNFAKITAAIKAHNPRMPVVVCRVMPSAAAKKRPREAVAALNAGFEGVVRGDPQFTVIDTWALFATAEGDMDAAWSKDQLHLNPEGYARWGAALRPIFATLGFLDTAPDTFQPEPGFTLLFNGRDLTGWGFRATAPRPAAKKAKADAPVFVEVKAAENFDGKVATGDGRYRAINGRLVVTTPAEGRRIQQLWTTRVFPEDFTLKLEFRATPNADSGVFIRQPQLQCRDYPLAGPYKDLKRYRPQDWNELVVTVRGGVARAECNGELLTDDFKVPATGGIGLEGDRGQMEYRRIRVGPLSP